MALYSDKVMDHFMNPRNVGKLDNPSGVGQVGNARCGDIMKIYIQVEDGVITDVKFITFGCASAIASSSIATSHNVMIPTCAAVLNTCPPALTVMPTYS